MSFRARFSLGVVLSAVFSVKLISGNYIKDCDCGLTYASRRVRGGSEAFPHRYPWMVTVDFDDDPICGGAIINNLYILTAGHCFRVFCVDDECTVTLDDINLVTIFDGQHKRTEGTGRGITKIMRPREFRAKDDYDIYDVALVKLKSSIGFTINSYPVCLPKKGETFVNAVATILGWGDQGNNKGESLSLMQTKVRILPDADCERTTSQYGREHNLCAYDENSDACGGDSGGPLVYETRPGKWVLVGIVSWGDDCDDIEDNPGYYAKVTSCLDWIYDKTQDGYYCRNN